MACSCDCGTSSHTPSDAGRDGGRDAGVDGGLRDLGVDAGRRDAAGADASDGGALTVFPDGWERVPYLPDECDAWRPIDPVRSVAALRWEPCTPSVPGCEQVVVDWRDRGLAGDALSASRGWQTRGDAGHFLYARPTAAGVYDDYVLATLVGAPVAVWRMRAPTLESRVDCWGATSAMVPARALHEIAIVRAAPVAGGTKAVVLVEPIERLNATTTPFARLTLAELRAESNSPYIAELDDDNVVFGCGAGSLVIASHAGGPFRQLTGATTTGDLGAALQTLWHGMVYYSAPPYPGSGWERMRRIRLPDGVPETFHARPDGDIGELSIDGEWATWLEDVDDGPVDGYPDRIELYAARTHGSDDLAAWDRELLFAHPVAGSRIALSDPILSDGRLAYWVSPLTLELLDLASRQRMVILAPPDMLWAKLAHLGPEYLLVTVAQQGGPIPQVGLRRFRIAELTGWEPLP